MACISKRRNRWVIDFYDNKGRRRWKSLPYGSTKGRAKEVLRQIEEQLAKGVFIPERRIPTFAETARDWLEYKIPNVRGKTLKMYRGHLKYHFTKLDDLRINRITTAAVERFITGKQGEGMNLTTLRKVIVTLNQVMNYAVRHKYVDHNPVQDAERPRGQGGEEKSPIRVLSTSEINSLLEAEKDAMYRTLCKLAIMTGLRQGELFGLNWIDVDWFNNQIHVQRTFNNGAWYKPKTSTSKRRVDLGPLMVADLKKWRLACPKSDLDLVFPNEAGNPLNHGNMLNRHFYPALKAAGIPRIRFHDLRHTYASLMIEQGESIKYIQSQLGHATPTITLNVYAHLMKPVNQEAARRLEGRIFG